MAAANSTLVKLSIGETPVAVACQTNTDWEITRDLINTACKDFNGFNTYRPGAKGGSISVEGIFQATAGTGDPVAMATALLAGTLLEVEVSSSETGVPTLTGEAYAENFKCSASGIENLVTFTCSLKLSGSFTVS